MFFNYQGDLLSLPQATKLEEHNRKYERQRKDKELREKKARILKAQEEAKKVSCHAHWD